MQSRSSTACVIAESTDGYVLPCKIAVYKDNGKTIIGTQKPTALMQMIEYEAIEKIAQDIVNRLIACMDQAI
ncbi:DUF302 domain-containing protein [Virgibacillus oceani]|uniref:DUF302 domain-containing protein n=1 Tax=Virgibacillus oceani TaxID=1479511 RepID=A0A917HD00_9BACI|nr:hypothetical protein GCM10011398_20810 [Virgibacillus oceani]